MTKLTPHNQRVLDLLQASPTPLTAYAILDKVRRHGLRAPTTVYRALRDLEQRGLIHKIESLNAFTACRHADQPTAHESALAICTRCGKVEEIEAPKIVKSLQKNGLGFLAQVQKGVFEIAGLCHACLPAPKRK